MQNMKKRRQPSIFSRPLTQRLALEPRIVFDAALPVAGAEGGDHNTDHGLDHSADQGLQGARGSPRYNAKVVSATRRGPDPTTTGIGATRGWTGETTASHC